MLQPSELERILGYSISQQQLAFLNALKTPGTSGYVSFFTGETEQDGSANFTWDDINKILAVIGIIKASQFRLSALNTAPVAASSEKQVNTITLTGTSGSANVTVESVEKTATFIDGVAETVTITINSPAVTTGTIAVKLTDALTVSGIVTTDGDSAIAVAAAIYAEAASFTGWTLTDPAGTAVVIFTCNTVGPQVGTPSLTPTTTTFASEATVDEVAGISAITRTTTAFVAANAAAYLAVGLVLTGTSTLIFTAEVEGVGFTNGTVTNVSGDLDGNSVATQANVDASGTLGEIRITADALYFCISTNTWVKASLATW